MGELCFIDKSRPLTDLLGEVRYGLTRAHAGKRIDMRIEVRSNPNHIAYLYARGLDLAPFLAKGTMDQLAYEKSENKQVWAIVCVVTRQPPRITVHAPLLFTGPYDLAWLRDCYMKRFQCEPEVHGSGWSVKDPNETLLLTHLATTGQNVELTGA